MSISQDTLQNVKNFPINTLLEKLGSKVKGNRASCPVHRGDGLTLSLNSNNTCFCHKCHELWDTIGIFRKLHPNLDFIEAVKELADLIGVSYTEDKTPYSDYKSNATSLLEQLQNQFVAFLHDDSSKPFLDYLVNQRRFSIDTLRTFEIGFCPSNIIKIQDEYNSLGLTSKHRKLLFENRITFPIQGYDGKIKGWSARTIGDAKPKYINNKESHLFKKGDLLFNLHRVKRTEKHLVVVEGYTDVMMAWQYGYENFVAKMGVSHSFSPKLFNRLLSFSNVTFAFDGDNAGWEALIKTAKALTPYLSVSTEFRFAILDAGKDIADVLLEEGTEALDGILEGMSCEDLFFNYIIPQQPKASDFQSIAQFKLDIKSWLDFFNQQCHENQRDIFINKCQAIINKFVMPTEPTNILQQLLATGLSPQQAALKLAEILNPPASTSEIPDKTEWVQFVRQISHNEEYPVHLLPKIMRDPIIAVQKRTSMPLSLVAQTALSAVVAATQGIAKVKTSIDSGDAAISLSMFILVEALSGEGKSRSQKFFFKAISDFARSEMEKYRNALNIYEQEYKAWKQGQGSLFKNKDDGVQPDDVPMDEPVKPLRPFISLYTSLTIETLVRDLSEGVSVAILATDEGSLLFNGHSYRDGRGAGTSAEITRLLDEGSTQQERVGGVRYAINRAVSLYIGIQPAIADDLIYSFTNLEQGFLSRMLTVRPVSTQGNRPLVEFSEDDLFLVQDFNQRISEILEIAVNLRNGDTGELDLSGRIICLSNQTENNAYAVYKRYYNKIQSEIGSRDNRREFLQKELGYAVDDDIEDGRYYQIQAIANKYPTNLLKLAAILQLFDNPHAVAIDAEHMENAGKLLIWYLEEALVRSKSAKKNPDLELAEELAAWMRNPIVSGKLFKPKDSKGNYLPKGVYRTADIQQMFPKKTRFSSAKHIKTLLDLIAEHGQGEWFKDSPRPNNPWFKIYT